MVVCIRIYRSGLSPVVYVNNDTHWVPINEQSSGNDCNEIAWTKEASAATAQQTSIFATLDMFLRGGPS